MIFRWSPYVTLITALPVHPAGTPRVGKLDQVTAVRSAAVRSPHLSTVEEARSENLSQDSIDYCIGDGRVTHGNMHHPPRFHLEKAAVIFFLLKWDHYFIFGFLCLIKPDSDRISNLEPFISQNMGYFTVYVSHLGF